MLPYLREFGWEPLILHCDPGEQEGLKDLTLSKTVPSDTRTWMARAVPRWLTEPLGLGNVGLRSLGGLWRVGRDVIRQEKPNMVFFSTTIFPVMVLGPIWKRQFSVPYIVDYQDPWLDDYYGRTHTPPPGGRVKHGFNRLLAQFLEPRVMEDVAHVVAVSPAYVQTQRERYSNLREEQFTVLPFGAPKQDFEILPALNIRQRVFDPTDGHRHFVYVGRAGPDMSTALKGLFRGLSVARKVSPARWNKARFHFVGTSYAPQGRATQSVTPIAHEEGVGDLVVEQTDRVEYFEALQLLSDADALVVIGSDSAAYSPSKIYPYVLARRPLIALLHRDSPAIPLLREWRAARTITFGETPGDSREVSATLDAVSGDIEAGRVPEVDWTKFRRYTAREMTRRLCEIFQHTAAQRQNPKRAYCQPPMSK